MHQAWAGSASERIQSCFETIKSALSWRSVNLTQKTVVESTSLHGFGPLSSTELEKASRLINEANQYLGTLQPPEKIAVGFSTFDHFELLHGIFLKEKPGSIREINPAYLIHEYGHAVIVKNLHESLPKGYVMPHLELLTREQVLISEQRRLEREIRTSHAPSLGTRAELDQAKKDLKSVQMAIKREEWYLQQAKAYEELFADLLAAVHSKDPSIIRKSLAHESYSAMDRDFISANPILGWHDTESHGKFAPTRSFIGKYYLSNPAFEGKEPLLIQNLFKVIASEIAYLEKHRLDAELRPSRLNARLIKKLRARMGYP
jgi:hypothetical protein